MRWYELSPFVLAIVAFLISLFAQINVNSTFNKFSKVRNCRNITGAQAARTILDRNGLYNVNVERVAGNLSDHYDPRANVVRLSDSTYNSTSVAAVGVAAHECGHAIQHAENYAPVKLRMGLVKSTNTASAISYFLVLAGLLFEFAGLIYLGAAFFGVVALFQLVTLPVEFDASRRAMAILSTGVLYDENEVKGARKVLTAAALTYVAALVTSILYLLRLLIMARRRN